jgi:16S rRNA processing protein RimM
MMETVVIGKIAATHGTQGALILEHSLGDANQLSDVRALLLSSGNTGSLPYFLKSARARSITETLITLEDLTTREQAIALLNKKVSLPKADFERLVSPRSPLGLVGFTVTENGQPLGEVEAITEQASQMIAHITMQQKEVLIPLNETTLLSVNRSSRQIAVQLPEGLLDIYLA